MQHLSRRRFLGVTAGAIGIAATPWPIRTFAGGKPDYTVAFLTDMHVNRYHQGEAGFKASLEHVQGLPQKPEFIMTGGDLAYDILATDKAEADDQYHRFFRALEDVDIPVHHTIGNHDCFGVYEESGVSPDDPLYGKTYYLQRFELDKPYYSFDHQGWHFVTLDSIGIRDRNYHGYVDTEQLAWLEEDLAASGRPTVVFMHIPLLSNAPEWQEGNLEPEHPKTCINNCNEVLAVLEKHPVKLALAGHLHINESYRFRDMELANIGAVSGAWWKGPRDGFQEGYALLEFHGDEVMWRYVDFGWTPPPEVRVDDDG